MYQKQPSEIIGIDGEYEKFCFDEACFYIVKEIEKGKRPRWTDQKKHKNNSSLIEFMKEHS